MSSKRSYSEVEAQASSHDAANKKRKQFKSHKPRDNNSTAPGQSLNDVKKRARDIERRFARGDQLPADVQRNLERELVHCKRQIEDLQHKKKRSEMISKYHKVRFFERQKAERLRKQLKKRVDKASDPEEKAQIEKELHIADVDWYYAKYFPFMERYISLYPAAKSKEDSGDEPTAKRALHAERPPIWKEIEDAIEKGQRVLEMIQERRPGQQGSAEPAAMAPSKDKSGGKPKTRQSKPDKAERGVAFGQKRAERTKGRYVEEQKEDEGSGNDSDGSGFFE